MYPINKTSIKPPSLKSFVNIFIYTYIYVYLSILKILEIKKTKKKKYEKERFNESIVSLNHNHRLIRKIFFTSKKKN